MAGIPVPVSQSCFDQDTPASCAPLERDGEQPTKSRSP